MKIFLADLVHDFNPGNYVVPLNIGLISAHLTQQFNRQVKVQLFKSPKLLFEALSEQTDPDIIALSNYSWNQELNRSVISKVHARSPKTVICLGGPHIRTDREGVAQYLENNDKVDYYCMFEGETSFGNLVGYFLSNAGPVKHDNCPQEIPGVAYLSDGELVYSPTPTEKGTIENIPSPYLLGILDEYLASSQWIPMLETNRGCPFHCTFCVWGISAMDKVRVFPLERVIEEIEYVAKRSASPRWIFADANFGMLKRDVEIAKEISRASEKYGVLQTSYHWWAKNSSIRTVEIASILGPLSDPLVAVQSLDKTVLKNIKRDNIHLSTMTDLLDQFHSMKSKVKTDVLVGMPGETLESHLETLRKAFDLGFDIIDVGNIRLLPGSEMESDECRQKYKLKTKYRLISGSYGLYDGDPVFEYEESVRASQDINEAEMFSLRLVHFLVWTLWNLGVSKPLLKWIHSEKGINPLDVILRIAQPGHDPNLDAFIEDFNQEAQEEWFDSAEELEEFYTAHFDELIENGFLKMNFKYLAKVIMDREFSRTLINATTFEFDNALTQELAKFCHDRIYFLDSKTTEKEVSYSPELVAAISSIFPEATYTDTTCRFEISENARKGIAYELERHKFKENKVRAMALTLEYYRSNFLFDFAFAEAGPLEKVGELAGSFDYNNQFGSEYQL